MSDVGYGTRERPAILDFSQVIRRVAWAGGATASITLEAIWSYSTAAGELAPNWGVSIIDSNVPSLRGENLLGLIGPEVNPPGPPSAEVKRDHNAYSYPTANTTETETTITTHTFVDRGKYVIYTNGGVITFHEDPIFGVQVPFIIDFTLTGHSIHDGLDVYGVKDSPSEQAALQALIQSTAFNLFDPNPTIIFPQLSETLASHSDTVSRTTTEKEFKTITFLNFSRIKDTVADVKERDVIELTVVVAGVGSRVFVEWVISVATWKGVKKFNLSTNIFGIVPDPSKEPTDAKIVEDEREPEIAAPAVEIKFSIDLLTLKVTTSRRNLT